MSLWACLHTSAWRVVCFFVYMLVCLFVCGFVCLKKIEMLGVVKGLCPKGYAGTADHPGGCPAQKFWK